MKIKVGDTVRVITGNDKGKEGKVLKTIKDKNRVIVEGVRIVHKHIKPNRTNETGGILDIEAPIDASNVKVINNEKKQTKTKEKAKDKKKESEK